MGDDNPFKFTAQQLNDIIMSRDISSIKKYGGVKGIGEALKVDINVGLPNKKVEDNGVNPFADREAIFGKNCPLEGKLNKDENVSVLRGGEKVMILVSDVQVGDVVFLKQGDNICAEGIVIQGQNLKVDESAVTGEPDPVAKGEGKDGAGRILSPRGSVSVDQRTNTLIVKDTAETIDKIQDLVKKLDIPIKQVTIEARIVTIDDTVSEELGVNWSLSKNNKLSSEDGNHRNYPQKTVPTASNSVLDPYGKEGVDNLYMDLNGGKSRGHWMTQTAFDTAATGFGISIGKIWDNILVDMYLSALETENKAEIISSPRVTTANQQEALIEQGVDVPTEVSSSSGATSTEWKKAVLSLKVTPQITPDNRIILDLVVTQDTLGEEVATGNGRERSINTQRVETQVLVENGETIVLGGIYQQELTKRVSKVPLLGDIPYLGVLFRYTNNSNRKRELLVFVTPKIVIDKQ